MLLYIVILLAAGTLVGAGLDALVRHYKKVSHD